MEVRAAQRTFEGAYKRTALSQFSFALVVLKIFTHEFYSIGALFAAISACILAAADLRRRNGNKQFFRDGDDGTGTGLFRTSGNVHPLPRLPFPTPGAVIGCELVVADIAKVVTYISVAAYCVLLALILRLE